MVCGDERQEAVRNRLLRRVDWRFLLPCPRFERCVCFADGVLAQGVALVSAQQVDRVAARQGGCDVAVVVDADAVVLADAWGALSPGGWCYGEWSMLGVGGPRGVVRRLRAVGFEEVRCYWPWPSRDSALFWLPLGAPGVLRYFFAHRPVGRTRVQRFWQVLSRALWWLALWVGVLMPICAVAQKPMAQGDVGGDVLPDDVRAIIYGGWSAWGFGAVPDALVWVLLTGGQRSINKVVGQVFAGSERTLRMVVKWSRVAEAVPMLRREAAMLQAVAALRPGGVPGVPQVLFCYEGDGQVALGETALMGQPVFMVLSRDTYRSLALRATDWLIALAAYHPPVVGGGVWGCVIEPVLAEFQVLFGAVIDGGMLEATRGVLAGCVGLPVVCEQRDFSPWNVLIGFDGGLVVLDWESAEFQGLPALDLLYFLSYLAFFLDGAMESGRFREVYRAMLDSTTLTGGVFQECLMRYAGGVGIDAAALRGLRLLVWLLHARSEYQRFVADGAGVPDAALLRTSVFVGLWEEEFRHLMLS